jgi:hypothetical protein
MFRLDEEYEEDVSDIYDEDEEEVDDEVDEDDEIYEEVRKKKSKARKDAGKLTIDEAYDKHVEDEDGEDDVGLDVDNIDDDNMDNEGSSKSNIFSGTKKDKISDKNDDYEELIELLKKQYSNFKEQLDSITKDMKKRITKLEGGIDYANPGAKALINALKKSVRHLENKQRYHILKYWRL